MVSIVQYRIGTVLVCIETRFGFSFELREQTGPKWRQVCCTCESLCWHEWTDGSGKVQPSPGGSRACHRRRSWCRWRTGSVAFQSQMVVVVQVPVTFTRKPWCSRRRLEVFPQFNELQWMKWHTERKKLLLSNLIWTQLLHKVAVGLLLPDLSCGNVPGQCRGLLLKKGIYYRLQITLQKPWCVRYFMSLLRWMNGQINECDLYLFSISVQHSSA